MILVAIYNEEHELDKIREIKTHEDTILAVQKGDVDLAKITAELATLLEIQTPNTPPNALVSPVSDETIKLIQTTIESMGAKLDIVEGDVTRIKTALSTPILMPKMEE